jgi:hypothetical protein
MEGVKRMNTSQTATATSSQAELIRWLPPNYFLENFALRADNSSLITALNQKELWYVPPASATESVTSLLLHTIEQLTVSLVEVEPDVFYLITSNLYTDHKSSLHRIDLQLESRRSHATAEGLRFPQGRALAERHLPDRFARDSCCRHLRRSDLENRTS